MRPKTLQNSDVDGARKNVPDLVVFGNGDLWQLLCKASSNQEGWMKSTKAMQVPGGCVVQVTTQQIDRDESHSVAEALCFVPGVEIADDEHGGRRLVSSALVHCEMDPKLLLRTPEEEPEEEATLSHGV